ncbi:universal stress protein family domain protein [Paecilomyces variotii No. 5]|uniref:Universal stress protein family domain protein n=1 Tax=Byssochlamys spectabilis (strain No. 5 / NBRC 109023) TaxID=1356009 RepID=V5G2R8_BYSSN|nr:universal stress protein family domain protein [Paecilomyces variotii No. 5]
MPSPSPEPSIKSANSAHGHEDERVSRRPGSALSFRLGPRGSSQPADDSRRRSIQFSVGSPNSPSFPRRTGSIKSPLSSRQQAHDKKVVARVPSPPPPDTYQRGVSFDTFDNRDATDFSFTLNYKHRGYQLTRRSRTFLCGTDQNEYSDFALEWLMDELVDDGDEIVCLRVVEKDSKIASDSSVEEGKYRKEAEKLFKQVIQKNSQDEKAISLVLELAIGRVQEIIQRMIQIYEPALLVVGTRGRNMNSMQGLLPGSVSKYCLQQSPIPVIVVRPSAKREKKKKKRLADPTRRNYNNILQMSEKRGSGLFNIPDNSDNSLLRNADAEAVAVAKAIGLPRSAYQSREHLHGHSRDTLSSKSSDLEEKLADKLAVHTELEIPRAESPNAVVMKSPILGDLDTPSITESESESDAKGTAQPVATEPAADLNKDPQDVSSETAVSGNDEVENSSNSGAGYPNIVVQQLEDGPSPGSAEPGQGYETPISASAGSSGTVTPKNIEATEPGSSDDGTSVSNSALSQPSEADSAHKDEKQANETTEA